MRKNRRGSKIADIVRRKIKCLHKSDENKQISTVSSKSTCNSQSDEPSILHIQTSMSNNRNKSEHGVIYKQTIFETSTSIQPSKPVLTTVPTHDDALNKAIVNYHIPASSILYEDLYLSDLSDQYVPEVDGSTTSSFDYFNTTLGHSSLNSENNHKENTNKANNSETCLVTMDEEIHDENVELKTYILTKPQNNKRKSRQAVQSKCKKKLRKNKRLKGEPYISAKGYLIPGKTLKESECMGRCLHRCTLKFNEEERLHIFSSFWNIGSIEQRRLYIVSLINRENTKLSKGKKSRRRLTNLYYLKKSIGAEKIRVCQKFFVATLSVSEAFVRSCFKKVINYDVVVEDKRGKHAPHNKKSREIREHVKSHIKSFPRLPAPRVREHCKREYLGGNLNLVKMHKLYKIKCNNEQRPSVELAYYRSVFKKDFSIGFHRPGRDICDRCLTFEKLDRNEKKKQKAKYKQHLKRIITARRHHDIAKISAQSGDMHFAEYDLKTICVIPSSSSKLKRKLQIYNLTLLDFDHEKEKVHCFCWHEGIARKGAAEIGSCLYKYLQNKADGKPITFMSDTCASQCRNMYISSLLLYCIESLDIPVLNHKYFERGHSDLEIDDVHSTIEQAKKDVLSNDVSDFHNTIRKALRKYPNNVQEMGFNDFIDIKYLKNILVKNVKVDCQGDAVNWLNIRWLQYRKMDTNYIYFKYDLDETEFHKIEVIRRGKRLQKLDEIVLLKKMHNIPLPVAKGMVL